MHQNIKLDLAHAESGKLYIENRRWIVHVFPDLVSTDDGAQELARSLAKLIGPHTGYDGYKIHFRDGVNA